MEGNQHSFWRPRSPPCQDVEIFTLTVPNTIRHLTNKNAPEMIPARFQIVMWITLGEKRPDAAGEARNFARCGILVQYALLGPAHQFRLGGLHGNDGGILVAGDDCLFNLA